MPILGSNKGIVNYVTQSMDHSLPGGCCRPIMHITIVCRKVLCLMGEKGGSFMSPSAVSCPFCDCILFHRDVRDAMHRAVNNLNRGRSIVPHFLVQCAFRGRGIGRLIGLCIVYIHSRGIVSRVGRPGKGL